jgi:hypothetical protein
MSNLHRSSAVAQLLFPDPPRDFPCRRSVKMTLRAAHVLAAGIFTGGRIFEVQPELQAPWIAATLISGCLLLALDLHESAAFLAQVRGFVVLAKLVAVALILSSDANHGWACAFLVGVSVYFSHAPARLRYFVIIGRDRIRGSTTRG